MADDDEIGISIVPELDERAAEKAFDRLKEGAKSAGKSVGDVLGSAAESWAADMAKTLDHGGISEALGKIGDQAKGVTGVVASIGEALGADLGGVRDFGDSLSGYLDKANKGIHSLSEALHGDVLKGVDDLASAFGVKLPPALQQANEKSKTLRDTYHSLKGDVKDAYDVFTLFEKDAPGIAGALGKIGAAAEKMAGPIAIAAMAGGTLENIEHNLIQDHGPGWLQKLLELNSHTPWGWGAGKVGELFGLTPVHPAPSSPGAPAPSFPNSPTTPPDLGHPSGPSGGPTSIFPPGYFAPGGPGAPAAPRSSVPPGSNPFALPPTPAHTSGATTGGSHVTLADFTSPITVSGPEDLSGAGASISSLYAFANSLVGTPYSQPLRNDCSGAVSRIASVAAGFGDQAPGQRFTTVNEGPRLAQMGFREGMGGPNDLSIGWYDHGGGNAGHTAATLPGGINAESGGSHGAFLMGAGAAGANSPQFDHHMYLPMGGRTGGGGGGGFSASPAGFGPPLFPGGPGAPHVPGGPVAPGGGLPGAPGGGSLPMGTLPNINPTNTYGQQQAPQLGSGSGFGLTGGGLIGMAEQAASMAAGAFSFGGGSMAAQLAFQELNLAVQKGGQMAATAAMAPLETMWLSGGQMGAPSVGGPGQAGWIGKLLGGLVGSQFGLPNIAGTAQPPKKQQGEADESKLGAGLGGGDENAPKGQGGQGGGGATPGSSKDNPLYTKSAAPPPGPPQGAATSAASMHAYMSPMIA